MCSRRSYHVQSKQPSIGKEKEWRASYGRTEKDCLPQSWLSLFSWTGGFARGLRRFRNLGKKCVNEYCDPTSCFVVAPCWFNKLFFSESWVSVMGQSKGEQSLIQCCNFLCDVDTTILGPLLKEDSTMRFAVGADERMIPFLFCHSLLWNFKISRRTWRNRCKFQGGLGGTIVVVLRLVSYVFLALWDQPCLAQKSSHCKVLSCLVLFLKVHQDMGKNFWTLPLSGRAWKETVLCSSHSSAHIVRTVQGTELPATVTGFDQRAVMPICVPYRPYTARHVLASPLVQARAFWVKVYCYMGALFPVLSQPYRSLDTKCFLVLVIL